MLEKGWIKLHRKLNKWEWRDDPNMVALLVHFLLNAADEPRKWRGVELKPGQFVSGRKELSFNTGISERSIRTCIERLKSTNEITIKSTNKYSVYTLVNWDIYNSKSEEATSKTTSKLTSKRPATDQQPTTIERKKEREERKREREEKKFSPPTEEEVKKYCEINYPNLDYEKFYDYYSASGWIQRNGNPMVCWQSALKVWVKRDETFSQNNVKRLDSSYYNQLLKKRRDGVFLSDKEEKFIFTFEKNQTDQVA